MSVPPPRSLAIWFDDRFIGELREQGNVWALAYDASWCETGFDLSPALPRADRAIVDGASHRPVQWFFDNLLPEEGERILVARDAGIDAADAFGLLQRFGPESAGALTLLMPGDVLPPAELRPLADEVLSARIRALPRLPLAHDAPKRMSLAGAQHKLAVVLQGGLLYEPVGRAVSTHLLKPDHPRVDDYAHSAVNEWFCMRLAALCGLPVPPVALRRVPEPVYLIQRFDRSGEGSVATRLHALDACQLLSLDRTFKYSQATTANLLAMVAHCRRPAQTRIALLRWQLFNFLLGNGDAHLKNLSFLLDQDGARLAPHYDLLSTTVYAAPEWRTAELTFPMGASTRFGEVRRTDIVAFGGELGIPQRVTERQLDALRERVQAHAATLLEGSLGDTTLAIDAGEARLLRHIVHGPLADALQAVAP